MPYSPVDGFIWLTIQTKITADKRQLSWRQMDKLLSTRSNFLKLIYYSLSSIAASLIISLLWCSSLALLFLFSRFRHRSPLMPFLGRGTSPNVISQTLIYKVSTPPHSLKVSIVVKRQTIIRTIQLAILSISQGPEALSQSPGTLRTISLLEEAGASEPLRKEYY
jgi:hypothetical protein